MSLKPLKKYIPDYDKGKQEVFERIIELGSVDEALRRGKSQAQYYKELGISTPSQMYAHSTVYELVEELRKY